MADLTWSTIKTPALTSEIRFYFGLFIDEQLHLGSRLNFEGRAEPMIMFAGSDRMGDALFGLGDGGIRNPD
jgi:hypothetical protein